MTPEVGTPFDVTGPGTPEGVWRAALASVEAWTPPAAAGRVVVVAPHPDDETLGVGGLISTLLVLGWTAHVVAVTGGEACYGPLDATGAAALVARRRAEQEAALAALSGGGGSVPVTRLGWPDGARAGVGDDLVAALRPLVAGADLVLAPLRTDGHPDHDACGAAAASAVRDGALLEYPIWTWHWADPERLAGRRLRRVELGAEARRRKASAIAGFRSQIEVDHGAGPVLPPHFLARFARPFEVVVG